jgi:hypothetical protein
VRRLVGQRRLGALALSDIAQDGLNRWLALVGDGHRRRLDQDVFAVHASHLAFARARLGAGLGQRARPFEGLVARRITDEVECCQTNQLGCIRRAGEIGRRCVGVDDVLVAYHHDRVRAELHKTAIALL